MKLFEKFSRNLQNSPDYILFEDNTSSYSLRDVDDITSKVYKYLSDRKVGKEDVVMILMPRCAATVCAFYGVLRSGACAVIVDSNATEKYREYFISDTKPKLIIDQQVYENILGYSKAEGWAKPGCHNAAIILYTSSSTGEPKGVIHEYGDIDRLITYTFDYLADTYDTPNDRAAVVTELYDVGTITTAIQSLYINSYFYIVDREEGRSPERYAQLIRKYNLSTAYLMPHMTNLKLISEIPSIEYLFVGFDVIENVYIPGFPLYNIYGLSENFCSMAAFLIDKQYDITPVGKMESFCKTRLVDENDEDVPVGKIGEVVCENPFFRGYLNKPEATELAKRNGLFHSSDMGYVNSDGNLVIVGRKTDLIKNGDTYIVPVFTQVEIKKYYNGRVIVRAYKREKKDYVVVFYIENQANETNWNEICNKLSKKLSKSQIPSLFIPLQSIPLLTSGKLDRIKLEQIFDKVRSEN